MKFHSERGYSLVETLVASAIAVFIAVGGASLVMEASKYQAELSARAALEGVRQNILANLANEKAWRRTIQKNSLMQCLARNAYCTTNGQQNGAAIANMNFDLYEADSVPPSNPPKEAIVKTSDPSAGFTINGASCSGFSAAGNDACPFQYRMTWSAVCPPGNCLAPQIKVNATLTYRPSTTSSQKMNIDVSRYSISNYYLNNLSIQNCVPKVQVYDTPGPHIFPVPADYTYMLVDAWGGGGGGGAALGSGWGCVFSPGTAGQATTVTGLPNAAGGPPGYQHLQGGFHRHQFCWWIPWVGAVCGALYFGTCTGFATNYQGGNGQAITTPTPRLPPSMLSCLQGLPAALGNGGQTYSAPGNPGGGGGAGSIGNYDVIWFIFSNGVVAFEGYTPGAMGAYVPPFNPLVRDGYSSRQEFVPATLPPGSNLAITVGQGGAGGQIGGRVGGRGANGLVRIIYW